MCATAFFGLSLFKNSYTFLFVYLFIYLAVVLVNSSLFFHRRRRRLRQFVCFQNVVKFNFMLNEVDCPEIHLHTYGASKFCSIKKNTRNLSTHFEFHKIFDAETCARPPARTNACTVHMEHMFNNSSRANENENKL